MMRYLIVRNQNQNEGSGYDPSNPIHKEVRTPKYRQRVEEDKTKYKRKKKHRQNKDESET